MLRKKQVSTSVMEKICCPTIAIVKSLYLKEGFYIAIMGNFVFLHFVIKAEQGRPSQPLREYKIAKSNQNDVKAMAIEKDVALAQEDKRVEKRQQAAPTFIERTITPVTSKLSKKIDSGNYKRGLKRMTQERRNEDIELLNDLISKAQTLKEIIENSLSKAGKERGRTFIRYD